MNKFEIITHLSSRTHLSGGICSSYKVRNTETDELNTVKKVRLRFMDEDQWQQLKAERAKAKFKAQAQKELEQQLKAKPLTRSRRQELVQSVVSKLGPHSDSESMTEWSLDKLMSAAGQLQTQSDHPQSSNKRARLDDDDDDEETDLAFTQGISAETLREISILKCTAKNPHIIDMREMLMVPDKNALFMVFEYLEMNLREFYRECDDVVSIPNIKSVAMQLMKGLLHIHVNGIMHRDITPRNIFITSKGIVKIANFEAARTHVPPIRTYSHEGFSIWYCAPEILLGRKSYGLPVDIWAAGTVIAELVNKSPLFPGDSEIDELYLMFRMLGTPTEETWPGVTELQDWNPEFPQWAPVIMTRLLPRLPVAMVELLEFMLVMNPCRRISAKEALLHPGLSEAPNAVELSPNAATFVAAAINDCGGGNGSNSSSAAAASGTSSSSANSNS